MGGGVYPSQQLPPVDDCHIYPGVVPSVTVLALYPYREIAMIVQKAAYSFTYQSSTKGGGVQYHSRCQH